MRFTAVAKKYNKFLNDNTYICPTVEFFNFFDFKLFDIYYK